MQIQIVLDPNTEEIGMSFLPTEENEDVVFEKIINMLMITFSEATRKLIEQSQLTETEREDLCFSLEDVFEHLLYDDIFPEFRPREDDFDLCDAAIIKAQDDIISDAEKRGITFQEALAEYNEKAKEYVNVRKMS